MNNLTSGRVRFGPLWGLCARVHRIFAWRCWPLALFFLPVVGYGLWVVIKDRLQLNILAANPGLRRNNRVCGSKHLVYDLLRGKTPRLPQCTLIASKLSAAQRLEAFSAFLQNPAVGFPVVLKPDNSERGHAVMVVSSLDQAREYLALAPYDVVAQAFVDGEDFGLLVVRPPDSLSELELSLCRRSAISVTGNGTDALRELVLSDRLLRTVYDLIEKDMGGALSAVPAKGEVVRLTSSFAISRDLKNVVFEDLSAEVTAALTDEVRCIAEHLGGFYAGRVDLRAKTLEHLKRGEFQLLEVNNVLSEPIHMFDPGYSLIDAYRGYFRYYAQAVEAGRHNVRNGACAPQTLRHGWEVFRNIRRRRKAETRFEQALAEISQTVPPGRPDRPGRERPGSRRA